MRPSGKPELLSPAGDMERLEMALAYGADAVYLAGNAYGMRAFAGNFDRDGLARAVKLAHARGVKVHVTCNTMARNGEADRLPEYLEYLSQRIQEARDFAGEDALVVYLDPADQNRIPELAARFGFAPVVSREAFLGGMRAVIRSKNILIDNSFATLLREAKEEFVFAGGMTDE